MKIADYLNEIHEEYGTTNVNKIMQEPYVSLSNTELEREFRTAREALEGVKLGGNRAKLKAWTAKVKELAGKIAKERKATGGKSKDSNYPSHYDMDISDLERVANWAYGKRSDSKFYSSTLNRIVKLAEKGQLKSIKLMPDEDSNKDWVKYFVEINGEEDDLMKKKLRRSDVGYSFPSNLFKATF